MADDDQGPMQPPRTTRDVMKGAPPDPAPGTPAPEAPATEAATRSIRPDQEAG